MAKTQHGKKVRKENVILFKQFTIKQFISLIFGVIVAALGLAFIITHLVGSNLASNLMYSDAAEAYKKALADFCAAMGNIGFLGYGVIFLLAGSVIIALALSLSSKTEDRAKESEARKAARRKELFDTTKKPETVEAVVSEVVDSQKAEEK